MPTILQDLPNNFTCWVETPNSGYHLYFKYKGEVKATHLSNALSVEVKSKQLTAAGSFKDGKPYVLHGSISAAPFLPKFIEVAICDIELIKKKTNEINSFPQKQKRNRYKTTSRKDCEKPSWEKITEWTEKDNPFEIAVGRNRRATYLAMHAKRKGYDEDETLFELLNDPTVNDLPEKEIRDTVKNILNI